MPNTITELPASPLEILENRSLYVPTEPQDPELAYDTWEYLSQHRTTMGYDAASTIKSVSFGRRDNGWHEGIQHGTPEELAEVLTLSALEWYIHQNAAKLKDDNQRALNYGHNSPIDGMINGVIQYQATNPNADNARHKKVASSGVFVVPEVLDGQVSHIFSGVGRSSLRLNQLNYAVIGNVNEKFAESMNQNERVELFGSASDYAFAGAGGPLQRAGAARARASVHGNVGAYTASDALSLILHVDGNAGEYLGQRAGYQPELHSKPEEATSVMIRVEGKIGAMAAHQVAGKFDLSGRVMVSRLGDISEMRGVVHQGPYAIGSPQYATNKGLILYRDGKMSS